MAQFLGFAFPFRKGPLAFPQQATDDELIKNDLVQLILTNKGERVMRPTYGSSAFDYIFESNNSALSLIIESDVSQLIAKYEPRVILRAVRVTAGDTAATAIGNQQSTVSVVISYVVVPTKTTDELTMTFTAGAP